MKPNWQFDIKQNKIKHITQYYLLFFHSILQSMRQENI